MKKIQKTMALMLAASMAVSLTACGGSSSTSGQSATAAASGGSDESKTLLIASSASSNLTNFSLQQQMADKANEASGGALTIELNWDGVLGDDSALVENCISGSIPMVSLMSSALLNYVPEVGVFDCPAVFDSEETAYEGVSQMVEVLSPKFEEKGLKILSMGFQSFRALTCNTELKSAADFKGLKIRTLENKYHMAFWNNLGATATPLAFSDLYLSLQQGLVDGQDNTAPAVYSNKFYEVQDYYMGIPAFMNVSVIIMNKNQFDALDSDTQQILVDFASEYTKGAYESSAQDIQDSLDKIGDEITVLPVTDDMQAAFKEAGAPIWDDIAGTIGDEIVDQYLAAGGITRS